MYEWWAAKEVFEKVFWFCAAPFSFILLIQMVLTFMGFDGASDSDVDLDVDTNVDFDGDSLADIDGGGFPFFTLRNFVAFFTVFGWTGITMINSDYGKVSTIVVAFIVGVIMMFLLSLLYFFMAKLASGGGTYRLAQAVGKTGTVYITVGAHFTGRVNVLINNQMRELDADTDGQEALPPNTQVKIKSISNNKLVVERA